MQRERLDRVGLNDVFVEPVFDSPINLCEDIEKPTKIHLRVVNQTGDRFTEAELEDWMSLDHRSLTELVDLCDRRKERLCEKYLPGATNPTVERIHCWVGPDGIVDVEVLLEAER